jgi:predicted permease
MAIVQRMANLFRKSRVNREIEAELRAHVEMRAEENLAAGMPPEQARREALLRFGNPASTREQVANADAALGLENAAADLRYAWRQLKHSPGFALTAAMTLAVAIAANAIVFSVMDALVLRPLNLPDARSLYSIEVSGQGENSPVNSYPDYRDLRDRNRTFDGIALYNFDDVGFDTGGDPRRSYIYEASGNYFDVLRVHPYLGRFFSTADEHGKNSAPYIVLSYAFWHTRFHGDPGAIGRTAQVNRHVYTIVGVAPKDFRGSELVFAPDFWVPIVDQEQIEGVDGLEDRNNRGLWLVGRLKPQVTVAQATADLESIAAYLRKTYPVFDDDVHFSLARPGLAGDLLGGPARAFALGLMALAGLILLAACANLGSLFAARAADRAREIALRVALGSTRRRIMRQLLAEALLISLAGGAAGISAGVFLLRALSAWQPLPQFPINVPVNPDATTYAVAVALALASGLLFGLAPLRQVFATAPWEVVKSGIRTTGRKRWFTMREVLLVVQIAACAVLMTSSLVALRGLDRSLHSNFGFEPNHALVLDTDLTMANYRGDRIPEMQRRMIDSAEALPGVTAAGVIDNLPLGLGWSLTSVYREGTTDFRSTTEAAEPAQYSISPQYFAAAGTTLLAGRAFTWHDDANAPLVAVVNREFARKVFGGVNQAVGGHFIAGAKGKLVQVVGVVEDGKYVSLTEDPRPAFFRPLLQVPLSATQLVVRTAGDPATVAPVLDEAMKKLDDAMPFGLMTWERDLSTALFAARVATISLGVLGLLGAILAITGIFGMASYQVSKRLREMGIRMALGAGNRQVLRAALGSALRLLAVGSCAGMLLGLAATRVLAAIVYQASPRDPIVLAGTVAAMLFVGLLATWAPAQRALRVNPSMLMREE